MALWSLVLLASGAATGTARANDIPIHVVLSTSVGCGSAAVYEVGEGTAYDFSVDRDSIIRLHLDRPDGNLDLLSNFSAQAGVTYHYNGVAGDVLGPRTVTVYATAPGASGQAVCSYTVVRRGEDRSIGVTLTTNKGCGSGAVFGAGETININYSVDRTSFVVLKLVGPNGTQFLKNNDVATAGILNAVTVTAGAAGNYTLILDAGAGGRSGHIECAFRVDASNIVLTLTTNCGCGSGALFHTGDAVNITFSTGRNAFVVLKLVGPGGTQTLLDNFVTNGGQLYPSTLTAIPTGNYTLILDAAVDGRTGHIECTFRVEAAEPAPSTGEIAVTVTTDRGCGSGAVYHAGDAVNITFSTSEIAFVVLKLVGPGGTQLLLDNFVANGGQFYPITLTAGATGNYTLILDAGVSGRKGHIECKFTVNGG